MIDPHVLSGIRVVDFSWVMAGPMATKMLAAMGAEVIKIESATRVEHVKRYPWSAVLNAGKRSCSINFVKPEGQALIRRLVGMSDIVVENFSAGVLAKYSLDSASLRAVRPDLVFVSASGVGREGPQRDALAYGTLLQAYSGRAAMIGTPNPLLEAMGILPAWTDPITALWECCVILAAIRHRRDTGEGACIDLSMLESTVALLPEALLRKSLGETPATDSGNRDPDAAPSGCYRCAGEDSWLVLSVRTDLEWQSLCAAMDRPELASDPGLCNAVGRGAHGKEIETALAGWLATRSAAEAEALLQHHGVPAARSRHIGDVVEDPTFVRRGLFPHLSDGTRTVALPWISEDGWRGDFRPAPALGADNDYVFGTLLGLKSSEIERLSAEGVLT